MYAVEFEAPIKNGIVHIPTDIFHPKSP